MSHASTPAATLRRMDERVLAERLITYDTSNVEGLRAAAGFIKGWLEARDIAVADHQYGDVFASHGRGRSGGGADARLPRPLRRRARRGRSSSPRASRATGSRAAAPMT